MFNFIQKLQLRKSLTMVKLIIFLSFICAVHIKVTSTFYCDQYADCSILNPGYRVPDPYNCSQYYLCITSSSGTVPNETPSSCPPGEYYNCDTEICLQETLSGVCDKDCCKGNIATTCSLQCTNNMMEIVPYPGDCSKYYYCAANGPISSSCADPKPYFNGGTCVSDVRKCCNTCVPYCFKPGYLVADPYDCTKYYLCEIDGTVQERYHSTCISGEYFNPQEGACVSGTSCTSFCSGTTTTTTTTSPVCPNTYPCTVTGNFPRCSYCDISYFHCDGSTATIEYCDQGKVFNTNPAYPYCVLKSNCPYLN